MNPRKPIAWYDPTNGMVSTDKDSPLFTSLGQVLPLYPQREWVGLTDDEINKICDFTHGYNADQRIAMEVEAKLKEKNT